MVHATDMLSNYFEKSWIFNKNANENCNQKWIHLFNDNIVFGLGLNKRSKLIQKSTAIA